MPFTVSLVPESEPWKAKEFIDANYGLLAQLYPDKWVVILHERVFFVSDTFEEMAEKATSLGMERGSYSYSHILPLPRLVIPPP